MRVICYGDSNTYGYDPRSSLGERYDSDCRWVDILAQCTGWEVINQGENGRDIPQIPVFFPKDTDLLIIMLGTNDLLQFWTPEAAAWKMERFLCGLNIPGDRTVLIAPPPMCMGQWVCDRELIKDSVSLVKYYHALSESLGIRFVDTTSWNIPMAFDGVHFTEEGNKIFADRLCTELIHMTSGGSHDPLYFR